ncbi:MAG: FAD binding domain-containing protein [Caldilinea sp.]|nr:FAD binding domain-containing protein [Caldilinea sp.]MDW8439310.1 FAD binding domain-containing protein [Caldilineaceae bacterium]
MPAHIQAYQRPPTPEQALALLSQAAGQAAPLIPRPRVPDEVFPPAPTVVDLQALPWVYISREPTTLRLGANTPLQTLVDNAAVAAVADGILRQSAELAAPRTLRNLATLAGAIEGAAEGPPELLLSLLALNATATVQSAEGVKQLALRNYRPTPGALLVEVTVELGAARRGALARVARTPMDRAIVAVVVVVDALQACAAVAGAAPQPIVVETALVDASLNAAIDALVEAVVAQAAPVGDYRGSAEYRLAMAGVLTRRALENVIQQRGSA